MTVGTKEAIYIIFRYIGVLYLNLLCLQMILQSNSVWVIIIIIIIIIIISNELRHNMYLYEKFLLLESLE